MLGAYVQEECLTKQAAVFFPRRCGRYLFTFQNDNCYGKVHSSKAKTSVTLLFIVKTGMQQRAFAGLIRQSLSFSWRTWGPKTGKWRPIAGSSIWKGNKITGSISFYRKAYSARMSAFLLYLHAWSPHLGKLYSCYFYRLDVCFSPNVFLLPYRHSLLRFSGDTASPLFAGWSICNTQRIAVSTRCQCHLPSFIWDKYKLQILDDDDDDDDDTFIYVNVELSMQWIQRQAK